MSCKAATLAGDTGVILALLEVVWSTGVKLAIQNYSHFPAPASEAHLGELHVTPLKGEGKPQQG